MKKLLITLLLLVTAVVIAAPSVLGFSIWHIGDAIKVATSMGAKLGCSGHFISGQSQQQIIDDLASYSPVNRNLTLHISDNKVEAELFGLAVTTATFRPGLGCTLDIGDTSKLDQLQISLPQTLDLPWPAGEQADAIDPQRQQQLQQLLEKDNAQGLNTRALLMIENGQLVAEAYGQGYQADTPLLGWSMGKSLTAMIEGRMEYLQLADARQQHLFPAWEEDERHQISLQNMLHMASGLAFDETYAPGSDSTNMLFMAHSASDVALTSVPAHIPGSHFSYSSGTTNMIMRWLHDRLGGSQAQLNFFSQQILQPLAMSHTVFEPDPSGVFVGSSYIYASGRDWARLGLLMLNQGEINGQQLLSPDWVARAITPNPSDNDGRYGYQFWLNSGGNKLRWPSLPADAYAMQGNRKQVVMVIPSRNIVLVRLGWTKGQYPTEENFAGLLGNKQLVNILVQ